MPVNPVTLQGTTVKMSMPGIGGTYEGKLEADGDSITGNWKQGPDPIALNLKRATPQTAWAIPEPPPPPKPMAADATPEFEVATIKPATPDRPGKGFMVRGRQFSTINTTLADLITFAYGIHAKQITGAPAWVETEKFDLAAQPNGEGQPNDKQWKAMIQKLLADRFKLSLPSRQERALGVRDCGGEERTEAHEERKHEQSSRAVFPRAGKFTGDQCDHGGLCGRDAGRGARPAGGGPDRNHGKVGLHAALDAGRVSVRRRGGQDAAAGQQYGAAPPDLFTAFQEQLGLKLESTKAQAEVFVIDKVAKPTEN